MKKKILPILMFCLLFGSLHAFSDVSRIQIPYYQKNVTLAQGSLFKFECHAWDSQGNFSQAAQFHWRLVDVNGFETNLPGYIDNQGTIRLSPYFLGTFKVVVTELTSYMSDEATVQVLEQPVSDIARIDVFPTFLSLHRGTSAYLSIRCFDRFGREIPRFTLRYYLKDQFGQLVPGYFATLDTPGILSISTYAWTGLYTLHFEDVNGLAFTITNLEIL